MCYVHNQWYDISWAILYIGRELTKHIAKQQNGDCKGLFAQQRNDLPQISSKKNLR